MSRSEPSVAPHYPKGWSKESELLHPNIARFGARFRAAKAFEGITFSPGISEETSQGYAMMTYAFLAVTAFEAFSRAFGLGAEAKRKEIEKKYASNELYDELRALANPDCRGFLNFLKEDDVKASASTIKNIEAVFKGREFCIITLGIAVRNAFAHGRVTPNVWKSKAASVALFCQRIAGFLVLVMDSESHARCKGWKKSQKPKT